MDANDGIDDVTDGVARAALTVAAQMGRQIAVAIQRAMQEAAARRDAEAAQLQSRIEAHRATARAELASVHQPEWWGRASTDQIARVVEVSQAWAPHDAEAAKAAQVVKHEVQERYGVDVDSTGRHTSEILTATQETAAARAEAARERASSEQEAAEARLLLIEGMALQDLADEARARADELEHGVDWDRGEAGDVERFAAAQEHRATAAQQDETGERKIETSADLYDSAERRRALAGGLEESGATKEQVRDRLLADADQARHPREAVTATSRRKRAANRQPDGGARSRSADRGR